MNRRHFVQNSVLALGGVSLINHSLFARLVADEPYKMKMVRETVGVFTEKGGTIAYLRTKEGWVVVDAEFPEQAQHLIDALKKTADIPINLLINTHHHGDHTAGNIAFKGLVGHVVAHENSLKNQRAVAEKSKTEDKQLYPDNTFSDGWKEKVGNESIRAYYFGPGHTDGDGLIHFENANVLHMGDLMSNRRYPIIDRSAGASIKNWIKVLDKTLKTFDSKTIFVFGHAFDPEKITGNKDDIRAFKDYLEKLLVFVGKEVKAGKTKEDVLKATAIPGVTEWQGDGIVRSLQAAYEEITAGK
ncbi:MBL fold metallo-hydrolase [Spirosoma pollinicola]|uniref:MBL fold metallo-hydrolase n=1 Tax=Spirosoma pollinicola TaxID=2057025 RepID=A0A2K8Z7E0_9BACT|nr:MBL fold metallo-hydrolase [Spirosoma pollinicola]AUD05806.1 MBL fold metallo-hydrolase [Spirosoma pollinicola]